jgi:hypothetical protein
MRTDSNAYRESIASWHVESLRLTAFTETNLGQFDADWFANFTGNEEISGQEERKTGTKQLSTIHEGGNLALVTSPGVFNLIFTPPDSLANLDSPIFAPQTIAIFRDIALRWIENAPDIQRLAVGSIFRLPVNNKEYGYDKISNYLNFNVDAKKSSDFIYQINRKREYGTQVPNLKINRVSRWSVGVFLKFEISIEKIAKPKEARAFCRIELDINTDPEFDGPIPAAELSKLFEKLVAMGIEIVEEGDIE